LQNQVISVQILHVQNMANGRMEKNKRTFESLAKPGAEFSAINVELVNKPSQRRPAPFFMVNRIADQL